MYRITGDFLIGKSPRRRKPWKSDSTWALIEMRNDLKNDIEVTPVCSRSALESEYKTNKNREVKQEHLNIASKREMKAIFVLSSILMDRATQITGMCLNLFNALWDNSMD